MLDRPRQIHNHTVVDSLSLTLAAVADPTRRMLLRRLAGGAFTVGELAQPFQISQQAVSKHLASLGRAGLVEKRKDGRVHLCSLNAKPIQEIAEWSAEYRRFWEQSFERLDVMLDELKSKESPRDTQD